MANQMWRSVFAIVLGISVFAGDVACGQEDPPPSPEIAVEGVADREIANRIQGILMEIKGFNDVRVNVTQGVVRLSGEVADSAAAEEAAELTARVAGVVTVQNALSTPTDLGAQLSPVIDRLGDRVGDAAAAAPLILVALGAFGAVAGLGLWITRPRTFWGRMAPNQFIGDIYRRVVLLAFLVLALVIALDILSAAALLGTVLGAAGILGLAVGFAVRDTVENFIASVMLSLRQPFRPNDLVEIEGDLGFVLRLTSRATVLLSIDGNQIRIPNARVFKGRIINFSSQPERRFDFTLGIDADAELGLARKTSLSAMTKLPFVLAEPAPEVWIEEVGDSNVVLTLVGWVDQRDSNLAVARGEAIRVTKAALENAGFGLPEPIYRVRMDGVPAAMAKSTAPTPNQRQPTRNDEADVDAVRADHTLSRRAAEERVEQVKRGDLLSDANRREE